MEANSAANTGSLPASYSAFATTEEAAGAGAASDGQNG